MVWISGSDQEKSLISAIEDTFNDVILVFCSLHLKDNLVRHMRTRNLPAKVKGKIMSAIFGTNGLVHCENEDEFNNWDDDDLSFMTETSDDNLLLTATDNYFSDLVDKIVWHRSYLLTRFGVCSCLVLTQIYQCTPRKQWYVLSEGWSLLESIPC